MDGYLPCLGATCFIIIEERFSHKEVNLIRLQSVGCKALVKKQGLNEFSGEKMIRHRINYFCLKDFLLGNEIPEMN